MMSVSPDAGQPTLEMLLPSIHQPGHVPCVAGSLMRASMRPYFQACVPCVFMRAEV